MPDFNPPAPCGAGHLGTDALRPVRYFNPPAPCGAGPYSSKDICYNGQYFNPPAPCGAGQSIGCQRKCFFCISIHLPRAGQDPQTRRAPESSFHFNPPAPCGAGPRRRQNRASAGRFQSTCPVRGRTRAAARGRAELCISIHLPRAGQDSALLRQRGGRDSFQSTCPLRGRTVPCVPGRLTLCISIHLPLAGQDSPSFLCQPGLRLFQSTCPLRGRTL